MLRRFVVARRSVERHGIVVNVERFENCEERLLLGQAQAVIDANVRLGVLHRLAPAAVAACNPNLTPGVARCRIETGELRRTSSRTGR